MRHIPAKMTRMDKETELATKRLEAYKAKHNRVLELVRATVAFEHAALKPLYFLNGGALVVLLAFLGAVASAEASSLEISWGFIWSATGSWATGLILAVLATAFTFRSQWYFLRHRDTELQAIDAEDEGKEKEAGRSTALSEVHAETGQVLRTTALWFGGASMVAFLVGVVFGILGVAP